MTQEDENINMKFSYMKNSNCELFPNYGISACTFYSLMCTMQAFMSLKGGLQ